MLPLIRLGWEGGPNYHLGLEEIPVNVGRGWGKGGQLGVKNSILQATDAHLPGRDTHQKRTRKNEAKNENRQSLRAGTKGGCSATKTKKRSALFAHAWATEVSVRILMPRVVFLVAYEHALCIISQSKKNRRLKV